MLILFSLLFLFFNNNDVLQKSVQDYLSNRLTAYEKFEFEFHRIPSINGNTTIRLIEDNNFKVTGNLGYIPAEIVNKGNRVSSTYITVRLKLYQYAAVAARDIQREEELSEGMFTRELIEVANLRIKPLDISDELLQSRAKLSIKEGSFITGNLTEPVPLVHKGEKINALAIAGSVVVSVDAISREDGSEGDIIRIVAYGNKHFRAKVIDALTVEIIE